MRAVALAFVLLAGCGSPQTTDVPLSQEDTSSSSDEALQFSSSPQPLPSPSISPEVTRLSQSEGERLVQGDMDKRFAHWVMEVQEGYLRSDSSPEARKRYSDVQANGSDALLAYEKANLWHVNMLSHGLTAVQCEIRSKEWSWTLDRQLRRSAARDNALVAARIALSPIELDTANAYSAFLLQFYVHQNIGKDREAGCRSFGQMPFMVNLDRYADGLIDDMPRLQASH